MTDFAKRDARKRTQVLRTICQAIEEAVGTTSVDTFGIDSLRVEQNGGGYRFVLQVKESDEWEALEGELHWGPRATLRSTIDYVRKED